MHLFKRLSISLISKQCLRRTLTSNPVEAQKIEIINEEQKTIQSSKQGVITLISINRPAKKNSLNVETSQRLSEALDNFENDKESPVCVLCGVGGNFCAGYDLEEIANYNGENEEDIPQFGPLANRTSLIAKPIIAALSGYTIGAGFELALMCDMRVMEQSAIMGFFNRRFGIPIQNGGTVRLSAMIGYSRAMDLILTGRPISTTDAFAWGLANRVAPCGAALGEAINLASSLVKFPQEALLADRMSTHFSTFTLKQMEEALQFEKDNSSHLIQKLGVQGAQRFMTGEIGRHGKFHNITPRDESIAQLNDNLI